jgi:hypothetical protein
VRLKPGLKRYKIELFQAKWHFIYTWSQRLAPVSLESCGQQGVSSIIPTLLSQEQEQIIDSKGYYFLLSFQPYSCSVNEKRAPLKKKTKLILA